MSKRKIVPHRPNEPSSEEDAQKVQPVIKKDEHPPQHEEENNLPDDMIHQLIKQHDESLAVAALELPKSEKAGETHSKFSKFLKKSSQGE